MCRLTCWGVTGFVRVDKASTSFSKRGKNFSCCGLEGAQKTFATRNKSRSNTDRKSASEDRRAVIGRCAGPDDKVGGSDVSRDFFQKPVAGSVLVSGSMISDVQTALNAVAAAGITVDGVYGGQTTTALSRLQAAKGLPVTGDLGQDIWSALMGSGEPDIFGRCLQLTASFEGTRFTGVVGNCDGAGITWGIIGFTLLGGELGSVLNDIDAAYPALINAAFGADAATMMAMAGSTTSPAQKTAWADTISTGAAKTIVAEPWQTYFGILGGFAEVQHLQVQRAFGDYWGIAKRDVSALGLREERDYMLMFDTAVQNGGMSSAMLERARDNITTGAPATAEARRVIIANVIAESANASAVGDVRARKLVIASGHGTVHGGVYDLDRWGLMDGVIPTTA